MVSCNRHRNAHQLCQDDWPKAQQVMWREPTHQNAYTEKDFALHDRCRDVAECIHQLLLDAWKRGQEMVFLSR